MLAVAVVAVLSAGALGWLGWLLVQQDAALERQRQGWLLAPPVRQSWYPERGLAVGVVASSEYVVSELGAMRAAVPEDALQSPYLLLFTQFPDAVPASEQALLRDERIEALAREQGFTGSSSDFIRANRKDPACAPWDAAAATREFDNLKARVDHALPRIVATIPKTTWGMESVPDLPFAFGEAGAARGSLKEGTPGLVRLRTPVSNPCSAVGVILHEGVPGHLLQWHTAAESERVSTYRRSGGNTLAYAEGWATYASGLAEELGLDLPPRVRAERLVGQIFMAARTAMRPASTGTGGRLSGPQRPIENWHRGRHRRW